MFAKSAFVAAAAASGALAMMVTSPTQYTVWDASSSTQLVEWSSVNTDASSFAIVLVNQDRTVLPNNDQVLADNISTSAGSTYVSYPSGSWPTGAAFQVNLIENVDNINTIYAQSNDFNITGTPSSSTSSSTTSSSTTSASGTALTLSASNTATGASAGVTAGSPTTNPSDVLPNTSPTSKSGALANMHLTGAGMGAVVFLLTVLGSFLA